MSKLYIDSAVGSLGFVNLFPQNVDVELTNIGFADMAFLGNDSDGETLIAIEIKTISELLASLRSGRLVSEQIPKMLENASYNYLMFMGRYRKSEDTGQVEIYNYQQRKFIINFSNMNYNEFVGKLSSINLMFGVKVIHVETKFGLVDYITSLKSYWERDWKKHHSYKDCYIKPKVTNVPFKEKILALIPGIGWSRAQKLAKNKNLVDVLNTLISYINSDNIKRKQPNYIYDLIKFLKKENKGQNSEKS